MVVFSATEFMVTHIDADGVESELTAGSGPTNYSINVSRYPGTGSIIYPASGGTELATGEELRIDRHITATQTAQLRNQGGFNPQTIENILDRAYAVIQENNDRVDRAIKLTRDSDLESIDTRFEVTAADAGKAIVVNATGDGFELSEVGGQGPQGPAGPQGPQGPTGSGSGDLLAAQNLNDLANKATAVSNLGLTEAKTLADATWAANKLFKTTSASAVAMIDFLDEDDMASNSASAVPSQQSVKAYVDAAVTSRMTGEVIDWALSTLPSGWLWLDARTIGDASSSATARANADTQALFVALWNSMADTEAPVSSERGANAAADFAAHRRLTLPDARDRVIAGISAARNTRGPSGHKSPRRTASRRRPIIPKSAACCRTTSICTLMPPSVRGCRTSRPRRCV